MFIRLYAHIKLIKSSWMTMTVLFDQPANCWNLGHTKEPQIAAPGTRAPRIRSADAFMCKVVFPNKVAVDEIELNAK